MFVEEAKRTHDEGKIRYVRSDPSFSRKKKHVSIIVLLRGAKAALLGGVQIEYRVVV